VTGKPALTVVFGLEERPRLIWDALSEGETVWLSDWLASHPDYERLIVEAFDLAQEAA
jgi:hypothetical protein